MESEIHNIIKINMSLSVEEALWLKRIVQNALSKDESNEDRKMRSAFWYALPDVSTLEMYAKQENNEQTT